MIDNDGIVYIGSDNGKVSAINSEAKLLWTFAAEFHQYDQSSWIKMVLSMFIPVKQFMQ